MRSHLKMKVGFGLVAITASALAQNAVTSVAGGGSTTVAARAASIGTPSGMARDASGNLYIADSALNRVYKVTSAGTLSIVAGNGGNGAASPYYPSDGDGGLATTAQLHAPASVALDSAGNLYIADTGMGTRREVNAKTGIINTVTVLANSAEAALVAIDAANDIFVADGCSVFKSNGGTATPVLVAGTMECQGNGFSGNGGPAIDAQFGTVAGLFMDASGNVFLTDTDDSLVLEVSGKTGTYANSNQFSLYGVVWSPQKKLYVAVGGGGTILTSPDMVNWIVRNSNTALNLKAIASSSPEFAAIGSGNIVVTSPDGVTWTAQKSVPAPASCCNSSAPAPPSTPAHSARSSSRNPRLCRSPSPAEQPTAQPRSAATPAIWSSSSPRQPAGRARTYSKINSFRSPETAAASSLEASPRSPRQKRSRHSQLTAPVPAVSRTPTDRKQPSPPGFPLTKAGSQLALLFKSIEH